MLWYAPNPPKTHRIKKVQKNQLHPLTEGQGLLLSNHTPQLRGKNHQQKEFKHGYYQYNI